MNRLLLTGPQGSHTLDYDIGPSLSELLGQGPGSIPQACSSRGLCGLCRVRVKSAPTALSPADPAEVACLGEKRLAQGWRLACRMRPQGEMELWLPRLEAGPVWSSLTPWLPSVPSPPVTLAPDQPKLGLAIDLGTTHLSLALVDRPKGTLQQALWGQNPQKTAGQDLLSRLAQAQEAGAGLALRQAVGSALAQGTRELLRIAGADLGQIGRVALVGNRAMLALFLGFQPDSLLDPQRWEEQAQDLKGAGLSWLETWGLGPKTTLDLLAPLGGFIGSDLLAGLFAAGVRPGSPPSLLIDFGTNIEIALWDGQQGWATSVAGGPAFEGSGLRFGIGAVAGAIDRLTWTHGLQPQARWIEPGPPWGLCGPGFVDLFYHLRQSGLADALGRFSPSLEGQFHFEVAGEDFWVGPKDLDRFAQAKAALGAGIKLLLVRAGMELEGISHLYLAGAFGQALALVPSQALGLLPNLPAQRFERLGNAALAGTMLSLWHPNSEEALESLKSRFQTLNLANQPEFEELFFSQLLLEPLTG